MCVHICKTNVITAIFDKTFKNHCGSYFLTQKYSFQNSLGPLYLKYRYYGTL